jgi:ABC-type uncharacterized transport system, permease component
VTHRKIRSPIFTVVVAFLMCAVILGATSRQPRETLGWFFLGPFSNLYFFGNMLAASIPLIFTGLAACIAFSAGVFNLGLEGQYYFGAIVGTIIALSVPTSRLSSTLLVLVVSFSVGGLLSLASALLKLEFGFSELISSFMIGQIFIYVGDFMLNGPFRDPEAAMAATKVFGREIRVGKDFATFEPSRRLRDRPNAVLGVSLRTQALCDGIRVQDGEREPTLCKNSWYKG